RCWGLRREDERRPGSYNDIDLSPDEFGDGLGKALAKSLPISVFYRDGLAFGPAEFAEPLNKSGDPMTIGRFGAGSQDSDDGHLARLLRVRRERPRSSAANERDELAPPHGANPKANDRRLSIAGLECQCVHRNKKWRLISGLGHSRPNGPTLYISLFPVRPISGHELMRCRKSALCH